MKLERKILFIVLFILFTFVNSFSEFVNKYDLSVITSIESRQKWDNIQLSIRNNGDRSLKDFKLCYYCKSKDELILGDWFSPESEVELNKLQENNGESNYCISFSYETELTEGSRLPGDVSEKVGISRRDNKKRDLKSDYSYKQGRNRRVCIYDSTGELIYGIKKDKRSDKKEYFSASPDPYRLEKDLTLNYRLKGKGECKGKILILGERVYIEEAATLERGVEGKESIKSKILKTRLSKGSVYTVILDMKGKNKVCKIAVEK